MSWDWRYCGERNVPFAQITGWSRRIRTGRELSCDPAADQRTAYSVRITKKQQANSEAAGILPFYGWRTRHFELSKTVGTTDMPGRRMWSWFCPGSSTIFTGTRWTTLT